jgi:hypothetical protein
MQPVYINSSKVWHFAAEKSDMNQFYIYGNIHLYRLGWALWFPINFPLVNMNPCFQEYKKAYV